MGKPLLITLAVLVVTAGLPAATTASTATGAAKPQVFNVTVTFTQKRPWTYYHQQVSTSPPPCTRTTKGNGADTVALRAKTFLTYMPGAKSSTGVAVEGTHARVGAQTLTVAGDCAPTYVFPSTWRIISETGGTVTAAEPNSGCKKSQGRPTYGSLTVVGNRLRLHWTDQSIPSFPTCPYFDGTNQARPGKGLPGPYYIDVTAPVSLAALKNAATKRITTSGTARRSATETCANIDQRCAPGITFNSTASVDSKAKIVLVRRPS